MICKNIISEVVSVFIAFITLIWLAAAFWAAVQHNIFIASLMIVSLIFQTIDLQKQRYPHRWLWAALLLQLCWLLSSLLTRHPLLLLGLPLQALALRFFQQELANEREVSHSIQTKLQQQEVLLFELRQQRHDFYKYITVLSHLPAAAGHSVENPLRERHWEVDHMLKGESDAVAGALFVYKEKAREKGIVLDYQIQQALSGLPFTDYEIISFIGNILDNALEAAEKYAELSDKAAFVRLYCRRQSGIWIITEKNDSLPLDDRVIERIYTARSVSTKAGGEGIGTRQIKRLVERYNGTLDFAAAEHTFTLTIKIPDIQPASR